MTGKGQCKLATCASEVIERCQSGASLNDIGVEYGVSLTAVYRLLRAYDIPRRDASTANAATWTAERRQRQREHMRGNQYSMGERYTHNRVIVKPRLRGERNHFWRGGRTSLPILVRGCASYRLWRQSVFERDAYTCVLCGAHTGNGKRVFLNVDHIIPLSRLLRDHSITTIEQAEQCAALWDSGNGRTLCHPCHRKTPTYGQNVR